MKVTSTRPIAAKISIVYPRKLDKYANQIKVAANALQNELPENANLVYSLSELKGNLIMSIRKRGVFNAIKNLFRSRDHIELIDPKEFEDIGVSPHFITAGKRLYTDLMTFEQMEKLPKKR